MKILKILIIILLSMPSLASELVISEQCKTAMIENELDQSSVIIEDYFSHVYPIFRRNGTDDVLLKRVFFGIHQFDGIQIHYKDKSIIHCWPYNIRLSALLMEITKNYYLPLKNETEDALKVHFHLHTYTGPGSVVSKIDTAFFSDNDYRGVYIKQSIFGDTHEYPSPWFLNYLTLEEANKFIKSYALEYFEWRGKEYNVK